jgi:hypothetical protein
MLLYNPVRAFVPDVCWILFFFLLVLVLLCWLAFTSGRHPAAASMVNLINPSVTSASSGGAVFILDLDLNPRG